MAVFWFLAGADSLGAGAGGSGNILQYTIPNTDNFEVRKD